MRRYKVDHPAKKFQHIIKLGEPHFDSNFFCPNRFRTIIEQQLIELQTDCIDIVQWLLRHSPNEDAFRIPILKDSLASFIDITEQLKQEGKIRAIGCYPYSMTFAKEIKTRPIIDCWVTYLNLHEREIIPHLNKPIVAIRPLAAGRILNDQTLISLLQKEEFFAQYTALEMAILFPLLNPSVTSLMTSITSLVHAKEILKSLNRVQTCEETCRISRILMGSNV